jgi:hypothetical protein
MLAELVLKEDQRQFTFGGRRFQHLALGPAVYYDSGMGAGISARSAFEWVSRLGPDGI